MFSVLWLLYPLLLSVVVAIFTYVLFFRKANVQDSTPVQNKIKYLKKHVPPSGSTGWQLKAVESGLRVWQKNMGSSSPSWIPGTIYSCSGIIPASQQEVLDVLKKPSLLTEWDAGVKAVSKVTMATNHDVITVSFNCSHIIARVVHQIPESFGLELNAIYSRHWGKDAKPNSEVWFMSSFFGQVIPAEGALWSCFLVSSIDNGEGKETESLVTLVAAPASPLFASIPGLTASRVAGLQDFFNHYKPDVSPAKSCESEDSAVSLSSATADADQQRAIKDLVNDRDNLTEKKIESSRLQVTELSVADDSHLPDFASSQNIENLIQKLTSVYEATEGTDGWISVGNVKGVDILKRPAKAGERPWDCLKGTSVVCVPIHYILAYVYSLEYRGEWDDPFLKGETVEEYDPVTKVTRMEYKPQWPASGRDFCNLILLRELDDGVFCLASEAVEQENCPEHRGIVRGEIIIAGFVMKQLSSDPPRCMVTYITRADLKGNLPARLVNRVTASQPQGVAVLRDKLEARYQADVASNSQDMSQIQKEGVDLWTELMKAKEARLPRAEEGAEREDKESMLEWTLVEEQLENESLQFYSDTDSTLEGSKVSDSGEMFPITEENMQLPFVDRQNIDFRTLGSQAVANLMGEVLLANQVNIPSTKETSLQASTEGDWSYQGTEKGIVILQKISPGEKNRSFLGKGMIKVKPPAVWEAVRNHMTRRVYDKMLKKIRLVRQIDDQSKILYVHHEAKQCILKQSRDFVVLTMEREESDKYVQASVSVQLPELPPTKDIVRAKVLSCGWIIEPVLQDGQVYSMVSYLVQVDFGGYIPARLMNLIARRQPLCVAYLGEYLEKSQN